MSQINKSKLNSSIIAALHQVDDAWRVVVAESANESLTYVDSKTFRRHDIDDLDSWLDQRNVEFCLSILPAGDVVCRTCALPQAPDAQLLPALQLQAETVVQGVAPQHRQGMAVLHRAEGESSRSGLIVAWPERGASPNLPTDKPVFFAPDVACLAAVLNGYRTEEPLLYVDRSNGSISMAMSHAQGATFRASRESARSREQWLQSVNRLILETAMSVGHSDDYADTSMQHADAWLEQLQPGAGELFLPESLVATCATRIDGSPADAAWWAKYGIAAGALLGSQDELRPLVTLQSEQPVDNPTVWEKWGNRLSSRKAAAMWLIAAVAVLALAPLAVAGGRVLVLHLKVGDLQEFEEQQSEREIQLAMYEELSKDTWPMAKLLADVVNCAPPEVTLETVILDEDDNKIDTRGTADSDLAVLEMVDNLIETRLFEDVSPKYDDRDKQSDKLSFVISGKVKGNAAYQRVRYPEDQDFANLSLAERLYGERARRETYRSQFEPPPPVEVEGETVVEANDDDDTERSNNDHDNGQRLADGSPDENGRITDDGVTRDEFGGRTGARRQPRTVRIPSMAKDKEPPKMPDILDADQIASLSREDARNKLIEVVNARRDSAFTDEQRKQMDEQYEALLAHMRETSHFDN